MGNPRTDASYKYNQKNNERIYLYVPKEDKAALAAAAAATNTSMRAFVLEAIKEKIERQNANKEKEPAQL